MQAKPSVAVITPTYHRNSKILLRCIQSVRGQTYAGKIMHFICHDGPWLDDISKDIALRNSVCCMNTPERTNSYGAGVRQYVLDQLKNFDYIVHLDDDNIIFPDYIEEHVQCLEEHPAAGFSICRILHNGPLPQHMGDAPKIITGVPPVFQNIDTLQVVVRTEAMRRCGWVQYTGPQGYCNDGYTYQKLGEMFSWVELPKLLAVHI